MKTLRYRIGQDVKPGILDSEENIRDASSLVNEIFPYILSKKEKLFLSKLFKFNRRAVEGIFFDLILFLI